MNGRVLTWSENCCTEARILNVLLARDAVALSISRIRPRRPFQIIWSVTFRSWSPEQRTRTESKSGLEIWNVIDIFKKKHTHTRKNSYAFMLFINYLLINGSGFSAFIYNSVYYCIKYSLFDRQFLMIFTSAKSNVSKFAYIPIVRAPLVQIMVQIANSIRKKHQLKTGEAANILCVSE
jgi:hypothetical protein